MKKRDSKSLEAVSAKAATLLPASEYLVDRHDIAMGADYLRVRVSASWHPGGDAVLVKVVFEASDEQAERLRERFEDEVVADDIDSGIGEVFEAAWSEVYPDGESVSIGRTTATVKSVKQ